MFAVTVRKKKSDSEIIKSLKTSIKAYDLGMDAEPSIYTKRYKDFKKLRFNCVTILYEKYNIVI